MDTRYGEVRAMTYQNIRIKMNTSKTFLPLFLHIMFSLFNKNMNCHVKEMIFCSGYSLRKRTREHIQICDSRHRYNEMDPLFKMYMTEYLPAFPASFDKHGVSTPQKKTKTKTQTLHALICKQSHYMLSKGCAEPRVCSGRQTRPSVTLRGCDSCRALLISPSFSSFFPLPRFTSVLAWRTRRDDI